MRQSVTQGSTLGSRYLWASCRCVAPSLEPKHRAAAVAELETDLENPVIVHGSDNPGVALPLDLVADHRVAAELSAEEGSQGLVAHLFGHGKAVKLAYLSQCRVTFENEVTKEAAAFQSAWRLRLAEQLGQRRQVTRATCR